jgi:hypothetical protein
MMFERVIQVATLFSSLAVVTGIYLVVLQLDEHEKARVSATQNAEVQMIYSAGIGLETYYETLHRIETDANVTSEDRARASYHFQLVVSTFERFGRPDSTTLNALACVNFNTPTGRLWLTHVADAFPESYRHWLDALNEGCAEKFNLERYYQGENPRSMGGAT